jgi:outer membrane protein OmpA-like peptidoglycan-associated protein
MPTDSICRPSVRLGHRVLASRGLAAAAALAAVLLAAACAAPAPGGSGERAAAAAPQPREALPLDEAVAVLAEQAFGDLQRRSGSVRRALVIDPLIDRATGQETGATRSIAASLETLVRERYPALEVRPFTVAELDAQPLILLGAITTVAAPASFANAPGSSGTHRLWAVLGDLRTGLVLSHPNVWVRGDTVDATPVRFFRDSPAWTADPMTAAYLRTCARNPGEPMDPVYLRGLRAQAAVAEAIDAYEAGRYAAALDLYRTAAGAPGGQQQRVLNGLYLTNWALGRRDAAEEAFARLVDFGLAQDRLAVKLLFRAGTTEFVRDPGVSAPYPMWLRQIADRTDRRTACLRVAGHASATGEPAANDRLSLARAERVRTRLVSERPALRTRSRAEGRGARETIVGTGTDDMRDALDRRVEFAPLPCGGLTVGATAQSAGG